LGSALKAYIYNSGLGIAEEKVDDVGVPKIWKRQWWLDMKSR